GRGRRARTSPAPPSCARQALVARPSREQCRGRQSPLSGRTPSRPPTLAPPPPTVRAPQLNVEGSRRFNDSTRCLGLGARDSRFGARLGVEKPPVERKDSHSDARTVTLTA